MIIPWIAAVMFIIATFSMADMALGNTRRHGLAYSIGDWLATLIILMLAGTALWVAIHGA